MRALILLLTIASIPLGHFVVERPAETRRDQARANGDKATEIPLFTADPNEAGPLYYRKADGGSPILASAPSGGLSAERVSDVSGDRFVLRGTLAPPTAPVLPALHLRI